MAEPEDSQDRTEEPTPRRRQQAREQGQVARSRELNATAVLLCGAGGLLLFGPLLGQRILGVMRNSFNLERGAAYDPAAVYEFLGAAVGEGLWALAPIFGIAALAALLAPTAMGGWVFSVKNLAPKIERLDPVKGLGRVFGIRGLVELAKALAKFLAVGGLAVLLLGHFMDRILILGSQPLKPALSEALVLGAWIFILLSASLLVVVAIDVPYQLWDFTRRLRMTRQQLKEELKETEGRPEVRQRIRRLQRELAQRRMMEEVPKADVVITNPTHYAVALRYQPEREDAPVVVAHGVDLVARRIRELAESHGVPLFEAPPLARALYSHCRLGQQVPEGLYVAVAQVLAYVYQLRSRGSREPPPTPPDPRVPEEFSGPEEEMC